MLDTQGVSNSLQLDFILYDISGETPCTGYIPVSYTHLAPGARWAHAPTTQS